MKGLKKFEELLRTDEAMQEKFRAAVNSYQGDKSEEAVFNNVLVPLAAEYGITATFDEFKAYLESIMSERELDNNELSQISGGTKGFGATACFGVGVGGGGHGQDGVINAICIIIGTGDQVGACAGSGELK